MIRSAVISPAEGSAYEVSCRPLTDFAQLQDEWRLLQEQACPPIFLDELWMRCWWETYAPDALLVRISQAGELVAVGLFALKLQRRYRVLSSRVALLHQTGFAHQDQIWIEYNGMLAVPGHEVTALALAVKALLDEDHCDEIYLSMLPSDLATALRDRWDDSQTDYEACGYLCDLGDLRHRGQTVVESLSSNTRSQIRRSLRRYESEHGGAVEIVPATTPEQAVAMFYEAGEWHRLRWPDSGFANPSFTDFHEKLIKRGFAHGSAQLFRIVVGKHVIGVFYFLVRGRRVYFYLQGVNSESDGKLKPGLSGHCLLMQHFLEQGYDVYDFMGGESQYKRQLANQQNAFTSLRIHNGRWQFVLEQQLRRLKHRLLGS